MLNDKTTREQRLGLSQKEVDIKQCLKWSIGINIALIIYIAILIHLNNNAMDLLMELTLNK